MKTKTGFAVLCFVIIAAVFAGCAPVQKAAATGSVPEPQAAVSELPKEVSKGTIMILATGGTIAGSGEAGKETNYKSGAISVEDLIDSIPQLKEVAPIEAIQICNVNSDDITGDIWVRLANTINELSRDESIKGFVITHGTDTLEETAYFLHLTVKTDKPVVITGSMRPASSISADGPMNLYQAVCTANAEESKGKGVLVVFSDHIFSARSITKTSTYSVDAIASRETGSIGTIRDDQVYYYETPANRHTLASEFSVAENTKLPKVSVIYFNVDADPDLLTYAAKHSKGLVIAGAGAGEFSQKYMDIINKLDIPVVISSRVGDGIITKDNLLCPASTIPGNNLPPQKAAVLLRLAIDAGAGYEDMLRIFNEY